MNNFAQRVLFAVPAAALFLGITWFGGWVFNVVCVLLALLIVFEMTDLFPRSAGFNEDDYESSDSYQSVAQRMVALSFRRRQNMIRGGLFASSLAIAILVLGTTPLEHLNTPLLMATIASMGIYAFVQGTRWEIGSYAILSGLYATMAFRFLIQMRETDDPTEGFFLLAILFFSVWGNDVFAYLGGKKFGKHKMAPNVSPGKTWEGFASGIVGAAIGFFLVVWIESLVDSAPDLYTTVANKSLTALWPVIFLVSLFGPIGDLLESRLKRKKGVKDSSSALPGHGGFFDRFDALIPCVMVVWAYFELLRYLG